MSGKRNVLSINGSYRDDGITDQALAVVLETLKASGAETETIVLREKDIRFCLNCRACTQQPGNAPGQCVLDDDMRGLIDKIEKADAYVLAAPTNFSSVTAVFKRFLERLVPYGYWPWGAMAPVYRKAGLPKKKVLLITSCAAPGFLGRLMYSTGKQLRIAATLIGAKPVGTLVTGLIAATPEAQLPERTRHRAARLARKLI